MKTFLICILFLYGSIAAAQEHQHDMSAMNMGKENPGAEALMKQISGTAVGPESVPSHMRMKKLDNWNLMMHGILSVNQIEQSGPRGDNKFFATSWFMTMAERDLSDKGAFIARAMLSLEPATVTDRKYPLLFQTGETAYGHPIVDGQHPHDLFMELSLGYARELWKDTVASVYFAPVGDPALGPIAFPHRISAIELPQATLSHHVQDSTHVINDVLTLGIKHRKFGIEGSAFHGAEPDEYRWDLDQGALDSWSTRFSFSPTANWATQVSYGNLHHPEELEPGNVQRTTASATYNRPLPDGDFWATSFIYGHNHKTAEDINLNAYLVESVWKFNHSNYLTGRVEVVDKDELFSDQPDVKQKLEALTGSTIFRINAFTAGYTRDFPLLSGLETGVGANVTFYSFPSVLKLYYGDHPVGAMFYFRIRQH